VCWVQMLKLKHGWTSKRTAEVAGVLRILWRAGGAGRDSRAVVDSGLVGQ
jgi:hypothetical protein